MQVWVFNSGQWQCAWLAAVPKWVMFHCLSVFITVFTTNLVLWCSVQLFYYGSSCLQFLQWRFLWLAQSVLWFCWCDDGSCKRYLDEPQWARMFHTHRILAYWLIAILMLFLTVQLKGALERKLFLERHVLWRLAAISLVCPPILLFISDVLGQSWGGEMLWAEQESCICLLTLSCVLKNQGCCKWNKCHYMNNRRTEEGLNVYS